ncbi:MAG: dUTP diphosphatase [Deltaproteobacteria bacterium]|jgi:dUTP pyrophosphatase|nr:dUTP diphosphatase [Deltaproteobacteria bacterium]
MGEDNEKAGQGPVVLFKRLSGDPDWPLPAYGSAGAAGLDLKAAVEGPVTMAPGAIRLIPTGWAVAIPRGYEGQIRPRSGLALKQGLTVINAPGTIDSDYRGEVGLAMVNLGPDEVTINRGDRLAQLVVARAERPRLALSEDLGDTARGGGGFGSTGVL